ncbi:MAG: hypothetical protein ACKO5Q_07820, partial [Microcystaceae cyanobacterium]
EFGNVLIAFLFVTGTGEILMTLLFSLPISFPLFYLGHKLFQPHEQSSTSRYSFLDLAALEAHCTGTV